MGDKPSPLHSLDRIDNDAGYSPENCRWATRTEQQRNQRVTRWVDIDGTRYRAADLADQCGLKIDTIVERAQRGLPLSEVIDPKPHLNKAGLKLGGLANGARQRARTHCKHGHEFSPGNIYWKPDGGRICATCHKARTSRHLKMKRAISAGFHAHP